MGQIPQDGENGQNVASFFLKLCCAQTVIFFNFCQLLLDAKNVSVLVLI